MSRSAWGHNGCARRWLAGLLLLGWAGSGAAQERPVPDADGDGWVDEAEYRVARELGTAAPAPRLVEFGVTNPLSGAALWGGLLLPPAPASQSLPLVVFAPGGLGYGSGLQNLQVLQSLVRRGYAVGLWDPDGRGRSAGAEDYNGRIHQAGLHALLQALVRHPAVDARRVVMMSHSLGLATAAGALADYPDDPPVCGLIDDEGPSDRFYITQWDNPRFGIFPQGTTNQAWWAEREAVTLIRRVRCPYLRLQTVQDHVHGTNRQHALDLINAATGAPFGGGGQSPWTRINGPDNPANHVYRPPEEPHWLPARPGPDQLADIVDEMLARHGPAPAANILFAVNVHDTRHVGESADTVLKLVDLFAGHRARADFYLTAPMTRLLAEQRPDVIARLRESGMTINYHERPPYPLCRGFSAPLEGLAQGALRAVLRAYETCELDPITAELHRERPGGYGYVARVFGRPPVTVSVPEFEGPWADVALQVFRELGARAVVWGHEGMTRPERPWDWREGLLVRPSDFGVSRWAPPGAAAESFWFHAPHPDTDPAWNPTRRLQAALRRWNGPRAPFVTALIHDNDFCRSGPVSWTAVYFTAGRPARPPFDPQAPDLSRPLDAERRAAVWNAYAELVAYAAAHLRIVTAEDLLEMAPPP